MLPAPSPVRPEMCRELNREPAWVAAIRLALLQGWVDVESVIEEANLRNGHARTVRDVIATMEERDVFRKAADEYADRYVPGPVLLDAAPEPRKEFNVSESAVHQWGGSRSA